MSDKLSAIFTTFQQDINEEQEIREECRKIMKDIEKPAREIATTLQIIHQDSNTIKTQQACGKARELFEPIREGFKNLDKLIPPNQYYRYNDHWKFLMQRLSFLSGLIVFLEAGILIEKQTVAELIGVNETKNIFLDLEDYLMGLLLMVSELARFSVNAVTCGDYERPMQISKFVAELSSGFRLLNLKNDSLRKKFDCLKYDVKKIEEVIYDLSIRGLSKSE